MLETSSRQTASKEHGDTLDNGPPVQGPAATNLIQGKDTDESGKLEFVSIRTDVMRWRAYHVGNGIQSRDPLHLCVGNPSGTENRGSKDGDTGNADPLLHDLEPND